ncbi:MAG: phosphatase PAP2 family protein [Candidatus Undinarchaeales archaeon]|jgi:membrane-associated phospholipid phosphatase|nr:phosphatase PAP2 family protein [Candidatus Undinarchaeales archaeon]
MAKRVWFSKEKFKLMFDDQVNEYTSLGGNFFYGFLFFITFALGYTAEMPEMMDAARVLLIAGILFTIVGFGLKYVVGRTRPNKVSLRWASAMERMNDASFPSIHSGRAVIIAYTFGHLLPSFGKLIFWIIMLGVPLTRVYLKKHFWSDIIAGVLFGFLIAYGVRLVI